MPIYEYECNTCRVRFERKQSIHDDPVRVCPECGGATRRVLHPVGIIFRGSGFYVTDNRKASTTEVSDNGHKKDSLAAEKKGEEKEKSHSAPEKTASGKATDSSS